jgi:HSP20 family protein
MTQQSIAARQRSGEAQHDWRVPALPPPSLKANVYESVDGEAFVVEMPVPGLRPDEIVIEVTTDTLTVSTQPTTEPDKSGRRYLERSHATQPVSRVIEFPTEIDTDNVQPSLENGYLTIRVPKAASGRRRVIRLDPTRGEGTSS